jgi:transcriptional regulator with XRE-family HTH domain
MMDVVSDHGAANGLPGELGTFLRACRERTTPRDVGLPDSGRRRTPGLRREEVATLAGVSVDYLVRLEQGRDNHPSADVLVALADAMRLTDDERQHLFELGVRSGNQGLCPAATDLVRTIPPTVQAVLDALDPTPAFVIGPTGDFVAWNRSFAIVAGGLGLLDPRIGTPPNLVRFVFSHPAARSVFPEWRSTADAQVGRLRQAYTRWSHDPAVVALVDELRHDPDFEVRWNAHPLGEKQRGSKRLTHPEVGDLALDYEVLDVPGDGELQLTTWLAADSATSSRLNSLTDAAGGLRLVERG